MQSASAPGAIATAAATAGVSPLAGCSWRSARLQPEARHLLLNALPPPGLEPLLAFQPEARLELRIHEAQSAAALQQPIQFGLFVKAATSGMVQPVVFRAGECVSMYGGVLVHRNDLRNLPHTHARRIPNSDYILDGLPLARMLLRPVPRTESRLLELMVAGIDPLLPSSRAAGAFTAAELARFEQSPLGFMANTAEAHKCNVGIESHSVTVGGGLRYGVPMLVATSDIRAGEEILSPYNTSEGRQLRAPVPQRAVRAPFLAASFGRYNLLAGNPSQTECLQRQRDNLARFVEDNKTEFDKLLYEPWTHGTVALSTSRGGRRIPLEVRPSLLVSGLLGVYPRQSLAAPSSSVGAVAGDRSRPRAPGTVWGIFDSLTGAFVSCAVLRRCRALVLAEYPGVLMSEQLMDAFTALYHCPTALRLEQLDYRIGERVPIGYLEVAAETRTGPRSAGNGQRGAARSVRAVAASQAEVVEISLVGDPTAPGAIINDGLYSGRQRQSTCTHGRRIANGSHRGTGLMSTSPPVLPEFICSSANCEFRSLSPDTLRQVFGSSSGPGSAARLCVPSNFVTIDCIPARLPLEPQQELLNSYGDGFWSVAEAAARSEDGQYCATCFRKECAEEGDMQMLQCSGDNEQCPVSRHVGCMPLPRLSQQEIDTGLFYCPDHLALLHTAAAAGSSSNRGSRKARVKTPQQPLRAVIYLTPSPPDAQQQQQQQQQHSAATSSEPSARRRLLPSFQVSHVPSLPGLACPVLADQGVVALSQVQPLALQQLPPLDSEAPPLKVSGPLAWTELYDWQNFGGGDDGWGPLDGEEPDDRGAAADSDWMSDIDENSGSSSSSSSSSSSDESDGLPRRTASRRAMVVRQPNVAEPELRQISVRTEVEAKKLRQYAEYLWQFSPAQVEQLLAVLKELGKPGTAASPPPPPSKKKMAKRRRTAAEISEDVAPSPEADFVAEGAGAAVDGKRCTRNRWYDPEALAHDYAEYRACCGTSRLGHLALAEQQRQHSSASALQLFRKRVLFRVLFRNMDAFTSALHSELLRAHHPTAPCGADGEAELVWDGGSVCASCFRAVHGVGRTSLYTYRKKLDPGMMADVSAALQPDGISITPHRRIKMTRTAPVQESICQAVLSYVRKFGQVLPNAKGSAPDKIRYLVPQTNMQGFLDALQAELHSTKLMAAGTLNHALRRLKKRHGITVSCKKSKEIAQCDSCNALQLRIRNKDLTESERTTAQLRFDKHLEEVNEQRALFETRKEFAKRYPWFTWTITFDGMDQKKTQLPHLHGRQSKSLETLPLLGVHAVGAFAFGAPVPVLGVLNFPDVCKDSDLSVTVLERILDTQWAKLEEHVAAMAAAGRVPDLPPKVPIQHELLAYPYDKLSAKSQAAAVQAMKITGGDTAQGFTTSATRRVADSFMPASAAAGTNLPLDQSAGFGGAAAVSAAAPAVEVPAAAAAPSAAAAGISRVLPSSAVAAQGVYAATGNLWPRRLHLTFDNATGEAKNQYFLRFLGLLVLHDVFECITINTFIVGHTHGICDQMFSVWAKLLGVNDAPTYEAMRKLFHEQYSSKIASLIKLARGDVLSAEEIRLLGGRAVGCESVDAADDDSGAEPRWSSEWTRLVEEMDHDLRESLTRRGIGAPDVQPHIALQEFSMNMKSWLGSMHTAHPPVAVPVSAADPLAAAAAPAEVAAVSEPLLTAYKMQGQGVPHVFAVERDEAGDVWLFNKWLANSTDCSYHGEIHYFRQQRTGSYTERALLFRSADRFTTAYDPMPNPPRPIDVELLQETVTKYREAEKLTAAEVDDWKALFDRLGARWTRAAETCVTCRTLLQNVADIGPIRMQENMSEAQRAENKKLQKKKNSHQAAFTAHVLDTHFGAESAAAAASGPGAGWWTKWVTRGREHIRPSLLARGVRLPGAANENNEMPYHRQPVTLCHGSKDRRRPLFESEARVAQRYLTTFGPPQPGFAVAWRCAVNDDEDDAGNHEPFGIGVIASVEPAQEEMATAASSATEAIPKSGVAAADFERVHHSDAKRCTLKLDSPSVPIAVDISMWDLMSDSVKAFKLTDDDWWQREIAKRASEDVARDALRAQAGLDPSPSTPWRVQHFAGGKYAQKDDRSTCTVSRDMLILWCPLDQMFVDPDKGSPLLHTVWADIYRDLTEEDVVPPRKKGKGAAAAGTGTGTAAVPVTSRKRKSGERGDGDGDDDEHSSARQCSRSAHVAAAPQPVAGSVPAAAGRRRQAPTRNARSRGPVNYREEDVEAESDTGMTDTGAAGGAERETPGNADAAAAASKGAATAQSKAATLPTRKKGSRK